MSDSAPINLLTATVNEVNELYDELEFAEDQYCKPGQDLASLNRIWDRIVKLRTKIKDLTSV